MGSGSIPVEQDDVQFPLVQLITEKASSISLLQALSMGLSRLVWTPY